MDHSQLYRAGQGEKGLGNVSSCLESAFHVPGNFPWLGATGGVNFEFVFFLNLDIFSFCHKSQISVFHVEHPILSHHPQQQVVVWCCWEYLGKDRKDRNHIQ